MMNHSLPETRKQRARAMTGDTLSSIGSFKILLENDEQCMPASPVVSDIDQEENVVPPEHQVQQVQYQATDALDALRQLSEGIRIITRQMKNVHIQPQEEDDDDQETEAQRERTWSDSCSTLQSFTSEDDRRLSELSRQLEGTLGADLMGLAHAAQMMSENSRMASREASQSVQDVHMAQQSIQEAEKRAAKAESAVRIMYKKQKELIGQLEQTKKERNVLKRKVKALMQENSVMKEQDKVVRALELHVVGALQAHEQQLALQRANRFKENKNNDNVATVRLESPSFDDEASTAGKMEPDVHDDHFAATAVESSASNDTVAVATEDSLLANVAPDDTVDQPPLTKPAATKPKQSGLSLRGGLGFGGALGFSGALGLRPSSSRPKAQKPEESEPEAKIDEKKKLEKTVETDDERQQQPALISPTNSVDDPSSGRRSSEKAIVDKNDKSSCSADTFIVTDGISPCNQASLVSPSPTESSTHLTKGFFHRSNKESRRIRKPASIAKKPLLQLDDSSVDATEGSHGYTSTSETIPESVSTAAASVSSCDVHARLAPPQSLSCDTAGQVSPFYHEYATGSTTSVLDDKAFHSLALPSFVSPSPRKSPSSEMISLNSATIPPELMEIAEIYAEIGQLHEC